MELRVILGSIALPPGAGPEYLSKNPRLKGLRKWSVNGHRQYLIFYLVGPDAIKILRVTHGSRDIPAILGRLP